MLARCVGMLDFPRATALAYHLMQCEGISGDVVEFGCFKGNTAALLSAITRKRVWVYDSFEGLPNRSPFDVANHASYQTGQLATTVMELQRTFNSLEVPLPTIVRGWFQDIKAHQLPETIAFAHLDCDFYESISTSLSLVYPRLSVGAICFVDDYNHPTLRGVRTAVNAFLANKPESIVVPGGLKGVESINCYFTKH
jgi:O-methyltransferase